MPILARNKEAGFTYEVLETFEAGIALRGFEVRALREGKVSLKGAYVTVDPARGAFVRGMHISPYQPKNAPEDYSPTVPRQLLLHKKESVALIGKEKERGLTIVPLSLYSKHGKIKMEIAVVRGKKKYDKRESIKKREAEREIRRSLKNK